jgi:hypothetical protein
MWEAAGCAFCLFKIVHRSLYVGYILTEEEENQFLDP